MKSLIVGIITQFCILVSIYYMLKPIDEEGVEVCKWKDRGAARAVLVISQGLGSLGGRARGQVDHKQTIVQFDELYPVLAGIPDHIVYRHSDHLDTILKGVDVVVYSGPSGVLDNFKEVSNFLSVTYPRSSLTEEPFIKKDEFVFDSLHDILSNATLRTLLTKKVIFVVYLTSVALVNLKCPSNKTKMYETKYHLEKGMTGLQKDIKALYADDETVFVSVPQWSIVNDKNPKLSVWGRGTSEKFVSNIQLVDACPLLASLLGIPIPAESVGRLPLAYLDISPEEEAKALACNALQLHQRVFSPEASKQNQCTLNIIHQIEKKQYNQSMVLSEQLIQISQSHFHTSQKCFDRTIFGLMVFALVGWIFVLITEPMAAFTGYLQIPRKAFLLIIALFIGISLCGFLYITYTWSHPFPYVIFSQVSLFPWFLLVTRYKIILVWCPNHANIETLLYICSMIVLEEILLFSLYGGLLTVFLITAICSLPLLSKFRKAPFIYSVGWYACCGLIVGLLNFPRELITERRKVVNLASTFWLCYGQSSVFYFNQIYDSIISQVLVIYMAFSTILVNAFILLPSIPPYLYYLSWCTFTALIFPLFGESKIVNRLIHSTLSFGPSLLLLSKDVESISYVILMLFVIFWVFLERSHKATCDEHWCNVRRGVLLVLSCIIGYRLAGRMDEHTPESILTPFLQFHLYWNNPFPYYGVLFFKYTAIFSIVMIVYVSLILNKWKTDMAYVYGLLFIEMICLRSLMHFLFVTTNLSEVISKHIFINMFAISFIISYCLGLIYSTKYVKKEKKDINELILIQNLK